MASSHPRADSPTNSIILITDMLRSPYQKATYSKTKKYLLGTLSGGVNTNRPETTRFMPVIIK
jgi:hypothetical protein